MDLLKPTDHTCKRKSILFRACQWIPVIFLILLALWSYCSYVIYFCVVILSSLVLQILYLLLFHILFIMMCWSYLQTVITESGKVPNVYKVNYSELKPLSTEDMKNYLEKLSKDLNVNNVTISGLVRFCEKCKHIKPDRAHHCSICGTCILKMDHHCPWLNNCVNFTNYKYFLLFLGYSMCFCTLISSTLLPYFFEFWKLNFDVMDYRHNILFLFFVSSLFGFSILGLFVYHCYLVLENRSTLEAFRAPIFRETGADKLAYHIGKFNNFQETFGVNPWLWLVPVHTTLGDGLHFPVRSHKPSYNAV